MSALDATIANIRIAAEDVGLPEFARLSGVPYTTLAYWRSKDWRPRVIETLAKAEAAADARAVLNPESEA